MPAVGRALEAHAHQSRNAPSAALTLLSQYMPAQYEAVRAGELKLSARELILHHVKHVPRQYFDAVRGPDQLNMTYLQLDERWLAQAGALCTAREIAQQPATLLATQAHIAARAADIAGFPHTDSGTP